MSSSLYSTTERGTNWEQDVKKNWLGPLTSMRNSGSTWICPSSRARLCSSSRYSARFRGFCSRLYPIFTGETNKKGWKFSLIFSVVDPDLEDPLLIGNLNLAHKWYLFQSYGSGSKFSSWSGSWLFLIDSRKFPIKSQIFTNIKWFTIHFQWPQKCPGRIRNRADP